MSFISDILQGDTSVQLLPWIEWKERREKELKDPILSMLFIGLEFVKATSDLSSGQILQL